MACFRSGIHVFARSTCGVLLALATACGDDDGAAGGAEDSGMEPPGMRDEDAGRDAGGGSDGSVIFTLTIGAATDKAGFELCLKDDPYTCASSDDAGEVSLEVPASSRVAIHVDKDGYFPITYLLTTETDDVVVTDSFAFPTIEQVTANAEAAGVTLDDTKGMFGCVGGGAVGGELALSPASGEGPFYADDMTPAQVDPTLDAFSVSGIAFQYNVEPGDYEATVSAPDKSCESNPMFWAASATGALDILIEPGRFAWGCNATCVSDTPIFTTTRDEVADAAACEAALPEEPEPACLTCTCDGCLDELNACLTEPGCIDIIECAQAKDCGAAGCYALDTCMAEVDGVPGGVAGNATMKATALGECITATCEPDACTPPVNGP